MHQAVNRLPGVGWSCGAVAAVMSSRKIIRSLIYIPGPSFGVSCLEVPDVSGLGRNQPGDPDMKVLVLMLSVMWNIDISAG